MSEDYIHVDYATEVVLDNWWLEASDIISYIKDRGSKDLKFIKELIELFKTINLDELFIEAISWHRKKVLEKL